MAGLGPQVVQVLDFATARAPELQALHELAQHAGVASAEADGKLASQRNQRRRRANAFKSHRMPRRLRGDDAAAAAHDTPMEEEHIALGNGRGRRLEMQTAPVEVVDKAAKARAKREQKPRCRKHRRRMHLLLDEHSWLTTAKTATQGGEDDDEQAVETPKWLATHAWHAKRMRMGERYGHVLARHRQDKGVSAALAALRKTATLHDASYYGVLELYGSAALVMDALQLVSDPSGSEFDEARFLAGCEEGCSMLYHANAFPSGAIAPVTFMWRPVPVDREASNDGRDDETEMTPRPTAKRQLWLWIHPAAFMEAATAIASACEEAMSEQDGDEAIEILDRRGHLARLELRGKNADAMLDQILTPVGPAATEMNASGVESDHDDGFDASSVHSLTSTANLTRLRRALREQHRAEPSVFSVLVRDPRLRSQSSQGKASARGPAPSLLDEPSAETLALTADILCPLSGLSLTSGNAEEPDSSLILARLESLLKWTSSAAPAQDAPATESQAALAYPYAPSSLAATQTVAASKAEDVDMEDDSPDTVPGSLLWSISGRGRVQRGFLKDHELNRLVEQARPRGDAVRAAGVPVLLVRQSSAFPCASGWDLVLSPVHASAFLNALAFSGAMVVGLDEHEAMKTVVHEPAFPRDFPDTAAGREYWDELADAQEREFVKKPRAKRVAYDKLGVDAPFQPNWHALFGGDAAVAAEENAGENAPVPMETDGADEDAGGGEDEEDAESAAGDAMCVLRSATYMEPFPFSRFSSQLETRGDAAPSELIPVAVSTLIRVALSFPRRGSLDPCSMLYVPTDADLRSFYADVKWSGREFSKSAGDELELLGFVTSAVYDRPKSAFRGAAFCASEPLQRLALAHVALHDAGQSAVQLVALTRTPTSRQLRPVVLHVLA